MLKTHSPQSRIRPCNLRGTVDQDGTSEKARPPINGVISDLRCGSQAVEQI
jgi:hypothetical protein